jgi:hypothetical protein
MPTPAPPAYPDVPWWSVLVAAGVFTFAGAAATYAALTGGLPSGAAMPKASALIVDTLVYMPHVMLLFGVIGDMITYDGVWSIPSLIGLLSIFLNYIFRYFWFGIEDIIASVTEIATGKIGRKEETPVPQQTAGRGAKRGGAFGTTYTGCNVQGFESFASEYAPQTLVITATIFSYYCLDLIQNRGWVNSIAALVAFLITFAGHTVVLSTTTDGKGCQVPGQEPRSTLMGGIRALAEGLLFGGTAYGIVQTYYPTRLPSSTISPFPRRTINDLTLGPDGKLRDSGGYPWVCLPNGQCVPDFGDKTSRRAFGNLANDTLGLGDLSLPSGCKDQQCDAPPSTAGTGTTA